MLYSQDEIRSAEGSRALGTSEGSFDQSVDVRCGSWAEARARPEPGGFTPESGLPTDCHELPVLGSVERLLLAQT
jgi:hypothetical protein